MVPCGYFSISFEKSHSVQRFRDPKSCIVEFFHTPKINFLRQNVSAENIFKGNLLYHVQLGLPEYLTE